MALAYVDMIKADDKNDSSTSLFDETLKRLKVWKDNIDGTLAIERDIRAGRLGLAIKHINQLLSKDINESKNSIRPLSRSELIKKRRDIFEKLGYNMLSDYDRSNQVVSCPKTYTLF
jgi:hypothetical protein